MMIRPPPFPILLHDRDSVRPAHRRSVDGASGRAPSCRCRRPPARSPRASPSPPLRLRGGRAAAKIPIKIRPLPPHSDSRPRLPATGGAAAGAGDGSSPLRRRPIRPRDGASPTVAGRQECFRRGFRCRSRQVQRVSPDPAPSGAVGIASPPGAKSADTRTPRLKGWGVPVVG